MNKPIKFAVVLVAISAVATTSTVAWLFSGISRAVREIGTTRPC